MGIAALHPSYAADFALRGSAISRGGPRRTGTTGKSAKNLSSRSRKNIPLSFSPKSPAAFLTAHNVISPENGSFASSCAFPLRRIPASDSRGKYEVSVCASESASRLEPPFPARMQEKPRRKTIPF
jgi:hypothetical protein